MPPPPGLTPATGDIVLTVSPGNARGVTLAEWAGPPQLACASLDRGLAIAEAYARRHAVDVWLDRAGVIERISGHRNGTGRA